MGRDARLPLVEGRRPGGAVAEGTGKVRLHAEHGTVAFTWTVTEETALDIEALPYEEDGGLDRHDLGRSPAEPRRRAAEG